MLQCEAREGRFQDVGTITQSEVFEATGDGGARQIREPLRFLCCSSPNPHLEESWKPEMKGDFVFSPDAFVSGRVPDGNKGKY